MSVKILKSPVPRSTDKHKERLSESFKIRWRFKKRNSHRKLIAVENQCCRDLSSWIPNAAGHKPPSAHTRVWGSWEGFCAAYSAAELLLLNGFQIQFIFMAWSLMKSACWVQYKPFGAPVSGEEKNNIQWSWRFLLSRRKWTNGICQYKGAHRGYRKEA